MFLLRAVLNILVRNASPRGPMYFRCLIFGLGGPCEMLFFSLFYCLLDMRSGECNVVSLYVICLPCQWICLFCVLRVCKLFGETIRNMFGCVCYFVVECNGVVVCGWRCPIG